MEVIHVDGNSASTTASPETLGVGPIFHAADITSNGDVLLSGGYGTIEDAEPQTGVPINSTPNVEMFAFDNANLQMRRICTAAMSIGRGFHTASITGRQAIFIGGRGPDGMVLPSSETVAVTTSANCFGRPPEVHSMTDARAQHAVAKMQMSGELLVVGGRQQDMTEQFGRSIDGAEVFSPRREP
jgi:hypothetical protein